LPAVRLVIERKTHLA